MPQGCDLGAREGSAPQGRKEWREAAAGAPGVEPSAQTHHPDPQVVLAACLLDDSGDLAGVGLVAAWHDHAQVEPPPCPSDALDRALQVLLGYDAVRAGLVRAEGAVGDEAPLAAHERVSGVALEQRWCRGEKQLDDARRRERVHDGHEAFDEGVLVVLGGRERPHPPPRLLHTQHVHRDRRGPARGDGAAPEQPRQVRRSC